MVLPEQTADWLNQVYLKNSHWNRVDGRSFVKPSALLEQYFLQWFQSTDGVLKVNVDDQDRAKS